MNYKILYPKNCQLGSSKKYRFGIRDPGSGKNLFRIPDADPQHCYFDVLIVGGAEDPVPTDEGCSIQL
jgi:hypothetical protein